MNTTIDEEEVVKFAKLAESWWDPNGPLKTLHDINPARIEFIKNFVKLPQLHIIDVGCGGGILSQALAEKGAVVTGLDVEENAIKAARINAKKGSITYVCQPLEEYVEEHLKQNKKLFDVITCMEMLEHVSCPEQIIKDCARVLKPGGYLFLSTINRTITAYSLAIIAAEYILNLLPRQTHDFAKFIKPSELMNLIHQEDLEFVALKGLSYNPVTRTAQLTSSVKINYLLACRKKS